MTDPTAKGYTEPTVEEMKAAVLEVYDLGVIHTSQGYSSFWPHGMRPRFFIRYNEKDGVSGTDRAWADAYSKLPAKDAPETIYCMNTSVGVHGVGTAHSCPCCIAYSKFPKPAPESEDGALRRAFDQEFVQTRKVTGTAVSFEDFTLGWNARARLDAERGR